METILVDDETKALDLIEFHIKEYLKDYNIVGRYTDIDTALIGILTKKPKILFLDINMPSGSGIELLAKINHLNIITIFLTAHSEYALEALKLNAFDYLLKPVNLDELLRVDKKIRNHVLLKKNIETITFKISSNHFIYEINEIVYARSEGNYTTIYFQDAKSIVITKNLKKIHQEYFDRLPFFRCHQSHIVNINHVRSYSNEEIVLSNQLTIPISQHHVAEFYELMRH